MRGVRGGVVGSITHKTEGREGREGGEMKGWRERGRKERVNFH